MRKLLPVLVVSILILGGLGTVAIPIEKPTEAQLLSTQDPSIEIKVKGGLLGYKVNVTAIDPPPPNGTFTINITTKAWFMPLGAELAIQPCRFHFGPDLPKSVEFWMRPIIGFGPANITLDARYTYDGGGYVGSTAYAKGFVLLIYVSLEPVEFGFDLF